MSDTIRTDDPAFLLLCRKAAAFDAIENGVLNLSRHPENIRQLNGQRVRKPPRWEVLRYHSIAGDWGKPEVSLLAAIEAAMSADRQNTQGANP